MVIPPQDPVTLPPALDPETLAAHAEAVRRLCRTLVRDAATADDLAQDALLLAWERPPRRDWPLRAWLSGVARNLARTGARGDRRRAAREERVARPEGGEGTADAVARLEERRLVVESVLALAEPYRSTLAMRWFDGVSPREIARRQGVPLETVRTRLRRGLDLLRAETLRRHGGDRRRWAVALAPLAFGGAGGGVAGVLGGLLVGTKAKVGVAAALVALAAGTAWVLARPAPGGEDAAPVGTAVPASGEAGPGLAAAAAAPRPPAPPVADPEVEARTLRGRVLSLDGLPIERARVHAHDLDRAATSEGPPGAVSGPDGAFALPLEAGRTAVRLSASAPGRRPASVEARAGTRVEIRLAAAARIHVRVLDAETDAPVSGAVLTSVAQRGPSAWTEEATTDADGRADVADPGPEDALSPGGIGAGRISVRAAGYAPVRVRPWSGSSRRTASAERPLEVVLRPGAPARVCVVDVDGATPVAGARVRGWWGGAAAVGAGATWRVPDAGSDALGEATTDAEGVAILGVAPEQDRVLVVAEAPGRVGLRWPPRGRRDEDGAWTVALRRVVALSGRVVDAAGAPVGGARVEPAWSERFPGRRGDDAWHFPPGEVNDRLTAFADAAGRFEVAWLPLAPDGSPTRVWATAPGHGFGDVQVASPAAAGGPAPVTIALAAETQPLWTLRVRDEGGAPVAGAVAGQPRVFPAGTTGSDGTVRMRLHVARGETPVVFARAPGFSESRRWVDVNARQHTVDLVLRPSRSLVVRTFDAAGRPVPAEVHVLVDPGRRVPPLQTNDPHLVERATSDADGWLRVEGVPPGPVTVFVTPRDGNESHGRVEVAAGESSVEVRLPGGGEGRVAGSIVEGEVLDVAGKPLTRYEAWLKSDRRAVRALLEARRFRFEDVPPGAWTLSVRPDRAPSATHAPILVLPGRDVRGFVVRIAEPGTIEGTLRRADGAPFGRVRVQLFGEEAPHAWRAEAFADAAGAFEVVRVPPGAYRLRIRELRATDAAAFLLLDAHVTLAPGERLRRVFEVVAAARVWVRCDDDRFAATLTPDPGTADAKESASRSTWVELVDERDIRVDSMPLLRGRVPFEVPVEPGRYRVRVRGVGAFAGEVTVTGPGDVEVELRPSR